MLVRLADTGVRVRVRVSVLSQPAAFVSVCVYVPADVYVCPLSVKLVQADCVSVAVVGWLMVRFKVMTESQPCELVNVAVLGPLVV